MPRLRTFALAALVGVLGIGAASCETVNVASGPDLGDRVTGMVADYSGGNTIGAEFREPLPRLDGYRHIDVERTVRKLQELNVNSYLYLVWRAPTDWGDLARFLPVARRAGIDVWVYIVPPSECFASGTPDRCSFPYKTDYVAWARAIATLSLRHDNLAGWMIDDFGHNLEGSGRKPELTPSYVGQVRSSARAVNRDLPFLPLLYSYQITEEFLDRYAEHIDGVVLAYKDDKARNTVMTGALRPQLDTALETLAAYDKPLVLMLYAGRYTASPLLPSTAYVRSVVDVGLDYLRRERIAGLVAYGVQIDGGLAQFDELKARIGRGRLALAMADHVPAPARSYAQAGQTVRVVPEVERVTLTFSHRDRRGTGAVTGTHQKQLLVDGKIVWREEVGAETGTWQTTTVDLTAAARGRSTVRITFRLTSISPIVDSAVDLAVDELRGVGLSIGNPRFEDGSAWQITRSGPYYVAAVDVYDPERPRRTFELLQQRFALFTDDLTIR